MKRRLTLNAETLVELTSVELTAVAAGQDTSTCASRDCYTIGLTCFLSQKLC